MINGKLPEEVAISAGDEVPTNREIGEAEKNRS